MHRTNEFPISHQKESSLTGDFQTQLSLPVILQTDSIASHQLDPVHQQSISFNGNLHKEFSHIDLPVPIPIPIPIPTFILMSSQSQSQSQSQTFRMLFYPNCFLISPFMVFYCIFPALFQLTYSR